MKLFFCHLNNSEPSIRGMMTALSNISATLGLFIVYLLNTLMPWRSVGLVCLAVPVVTMIAVCFIPETPLWLLSKNREKEAMASLQWLRGWVINLIEKQTKILITFKFNFFSLKSILSPLGSKRKRFRRVSSVATIQYAFKVLQRLRQAKSNM